MVSFSASSRSVIWSRASSATGSSLSSSWSITSEGRSDEEKVARPSLDHEHGGLHGAGAEPVQGFLAGINLIGACGDRRTGLDTVGGGRPGGNAEMLCRR